VRSFHLEPSDPSNPQVVAIAWGTLGLAFVTALVQHQYVPAVLIAVFGIPRAIFLLFGVAQLKRASAVTYFAAIVVGIYVLFTKLHAQLLPYIQ